MTTNLGNNKLNKMKRMESRKSHSWWWDSHNSPKNKWLQENLEVMDGYVKRMLKLIEEDADSFAKKAEMYYKKRPELINLVEEFYRMYRALSERYDIVSGELRKRGPSDIHSQTSGISDTSSDHASTLSSLDQNLERRGSGPRAAGFDIFLGGGNGNANGNGNKLEQSNKEGVESLSSDSESESEDSLVLNYADHEEQELLRRRIAELEVEISQLKDQSGSLDEENSEAVQDKFAEYEEKLNDYTEKFRLSEETINELKDELQKYNTIAKQDEEKGGEIRILEDDLKITNAKLLASETDVENLRQQLQKSEFLVKQLQDQLGVVQNDVSHWKNKFQDEKNEVSALKDRVLTYESRLSDRDQEIKKLRDAMSVADKIFSEIRMLEEELRITKEKLLASETDVENLKQKLQKSEFSVNHLQDQLGSSVQNDVSLWKNMLEVEKDRVLKCESSLSDRDQEIKKLTESISNANKTFGEENSRLKTDIERLVHEKKHLEDNLKEMDSKFQSLKAEKEAEMKRLKSEVDEKNKSIESITLSYETLLTKSKSVYTKITEYIAEIEVKNIKLNEMNKHLHQLHMEHVELIVAAEGARKYAQELKAKVTELELKVEKQQEVIDQGAEEKREAIRQLCLSLEYYRNGYHKFRQAIIEHKRLPVIAS